ncbi:DUF1566 domain-containing protein [Dyella halodurans]|uniref:DUF1566 domain-containing protein n=1 Tax=Dyella halodurans TaxID=1920171 RepID=A0ABV9C072_9GAMM|nr:DUF1566 domain-containing protein [Dyella halodurans]
MSRFTKIGADGAQLAAEATDHVAVLDTKLGLIWSADYVGERHTFADAQEACASLELAGFNDWRAPTVEELFLLADRTKFDPAIDTDAFPSAKNDWCWTSTLDASSPSDYAWYVYFGGGGAFCNGQNDLARVRACRSVSPAGQ